MNVNLGDARDRLSELVKSVLDGEEVTICRNGDPVVDLVRTRRADPVARKFGTMKDKIFINDPDWDKGPETDTELQAWLKGEFD